MGAHTQIHTISLLLSSKCSTRLGRYLWYVYMYYTCTCIKYWYLCRSRMLYRHCTCVCDLPTILHYDVLCSSMIGRDALPTGDGVAEEPASVSLVCVCVCVCVCACVCVRKCMHACMRVCVHTATATYDVQNNKLCFGHILLTCMHMYIHVRTHKHTCRMSVC